MLARADYGGKLSAVNPAWTSVLGWSAEELLTNPYADIIHPEDVPATTAALADMGRTGQPNSVREPHIDQVRRNGQPSDGPSRRRPTA